MMLTLDTCVVLGLVNGDLDDEAAAAQDLIGLAELGVINLQLTESFRRDLARNRDPQRRIRNLDWLSTAPVARAIAGGPFRLDVSTLDTADFTADPELELLSQELEALFEMKGKTPDQQYSDIDHLLAHKYSDADVFVTVDCATILRFREGLETLGILTALPSEVVADLTA